jgi:peptidoglycan hydrolase CwlO-like protein
MASTLEQQICKTEASISEYRTELKAAQAKIEQSDNEKKEAYYIGEANSLRALVDKCQNELFLLQKELNSQGVPSPLLYLYPARHAQLLSCTDPV